MPTPPVWVSTTTAPARSAPAPLPNAPAAVFAAVPEPEPAHAPAPTLTSPDGRVVLTAASLTVDGRTFGLLELEHVEVTPVHWLLWYLLGSLTLAGFGLAFLQNWLRTMPAVGGLIAGALLLAYGRRGTNRLRLHLLGREPQHFALAGEPEPWQKLVAETNRRVQRRHDETAAATAALLLPPTPPTEDLPA